MDKNRMIDEKNSTVPRWEVHRFSGGMQPVQRQYGLRIIGVSTNESPCDSYQLCPQRYFEFYCLSHLYAGSGRFWIENGREQPMVPGDAVLMTPGLIHRYGGSDGQPYHEDTVNFYGPVADMLRDSGVLTAGLVHLGTVRRLLPIAELAHDPAADAQINANFALQQLLIDIYNDSRRSGSADVIDQLLATIKSRLDHWWTIKELADLANLSDDQLRRRFVERTGLLPKTYIEQLKMRKAAELLLAGELKQQEIARRLGYLDKFHFSRRFKAAIGVAPSEYRKEFESGRVVTEQQNENQ